MGIADYSPLKLGLRSGAFATRRGKVIHSGFGDIEPMLSQVRRGCSHCRDEWRLGMDEICAHPAIIDCDNQPALDSIGIRGIERAANSFTNLRYDALERYVISRD